MLPSSALRTIGNGKKTKLRTIRRGEQGKTEVKNVIMKMWIEKTDVDAAQRPKCTFVTLWCLFNTELGG